MKLGWEAGLGTTSWRERDLLVIEPAALTGGSRAEDAYVVVEDPLEPVPAFALEGWAMGRDGGPRLLVVDPGRLMIALRRTLPIVTAFSPEDLDDAMETYSTRIGASGSG